MVTEWDIGAGAIALRFAIGWIGGCGVISDSEDEHNADLCGGVICDCESQGSG